MMKYMRKFINVLFSLNVQQYYVFYMRLSFISMQDLENLTTI